MRILITLLIFMPFLVHSQIWDSLGTVVPGNIKYIEEHNGKLYISKLYGGPANGATLFGIGTWDGTVWDSVGGGIDGIVYGSAIYNNKLFFGGDFIYAGGPFSGGLTQSINHLTSWDGFQYTDHGMPGSGRINTLRVYKNELYIGLKNSMPTINGQTYSGILRYNDTTYTDVGGGVFQNFREVIAMTEYNGDLIVAGRFDLAGTLPVNNIARWDGNQWHAMGDGLNYYVRSLCVDTVNNILYAGGTFSHSGSTRTQSVAWWDGAAWQPMDTTIGGSVAALTFYKGVLHAGVNATVSQNPSSILKWNGSNWIPIIPYPDGGTTTSLKEYQGWLYVAGGYMIDGVVYYASRYMDTTTVSLPPEISSAENFFTIHPNPAKGSITLTFNKPIINSAEIIIYNLKGEAVLKEQRIMLNERTELNLPEGIGPGVYVCKVIGKEVEYSKSFVVDLN